MNIQFLALLVRVSAIFILVYSMYSVMGNLPILFDYYQYKDSVPFIVYLVQVVPFLLSLLLWFFAAPISRIITPASTNTTPLAQTPIDDIQITVFQAFGLFLLLITSKEILEVFMYLGFDETSFVQKSVIVYVVVKLILSFWLLFGSKGIVGLLRLAREAGNR